MKIKFIFVILLFIPLFFLLNCGDKEIRNNRVVIAISSDAETFNPMYAFKMFEGSITELLYLSLVKHNWNSEKGEIETSPMLAKSWEWNNDSTSITINLRDDVYWSDSVKTTVEDVVFSFDVYSDPATQSKFYGIFENYYTDADNHINTQKSFEVINPYKLKIYFLPNALPSYFDFDFPIIPKHVFEKINRKNFTSADENFSTVSNGPFMLTKWDKNQTITLRANENSFLYNPNNVSELIFKVISDYNSQLTQLKNGEVDIVENIKTEDIKQLKKNKAIAIGAVKGRSYDYIGWNNIDPEVYSQNKKLVANKLFGSANVRKALTYAINRKEILEEFLGNYGEIATGPITPIFKDAVNNDIKPYPYDPKKARELLAAEGWKDLNNDGLLEKGSQKFSFKLYYSTVNPRRNYAAAVIKNNLKAVGIDMQLEPQESNVFIGDIKQKKINAWLAGWVIPIPIELKLFWYSDLQEAPFNFSSYQSNLADELIRRMDSKINKQELYRLYKEFQTVIHQDEPNTFLYWVDNLTAYNSRIKGIDINPLGVVHDCWLWSVK